MHFNNNIFSISIILRYVVYMYFTMVYFIISLLYFILFALVFGVLALSLCLPVVVGAPECRQTAENSPIFPTATDDILSLLPNG